MQGCVFKMKFRELSREFESIETSPGFAQLPGENWNLSHKKVNNLDQVRKKLSNNKSLEVNVAISQKKLSGMIFHKKNDRKKNERKS